MVDFGNIRENIKEVENLGNEICSYIYKNRVEEAFTKLESYCLCLEGIMNRAVKGGYLSAEGIGLLNSKLNILLAGFQNKDYVTVIDILKYDLKVLLNEPNCRDN
jgi:hypothetical protein